MKERDKGRGAGKESRTALGHEGYNHEAKGKGNGGSEGKVSKGTVSESHGSSAGELFKNILVALDTSAHSKAALETAAHMAERFRAGLKGLFVHEPGWTHRSKLTRSLRIDHPSGEMHVVAEETVEVELRGKERETERHFRKVTEERSLPSEWRVEKGAVKERIKEAAGEVDLVTLGVSGISHLKTQKLGSTAMSLIEECDKPVVLLKEGLDLSGEIISVYDGSADSLVVVETGARIARKHDGTFLVIHFGEEHKAELSEKLDDLFDELKVLPRFYQIPEKDDGSYLYLLNMTRGGLLILPKGSRFARREPLLRILEAAHCPVMLI